ncbi:MAG TPA: response regulator, partial [Chthoniobacteraceae bacterium]|nr:response regulator [Chthoniobacteraceae bacterium]
DVVLMDVRMPNLDGIELAKIIKQRKKTQHIPIVFLTAYDQGEEQIVMGYGAGGADFITKPVNPAILRSKIGVFIELFKKTRSLAEMNAALASEIGERQKAEERFRLVVESSPNAIIVFDSKRRITLVNPGAESLFGYERPELLAMSIDMVIPEMFGPGGDDSGPFVIPHTGGEFFARRKDGSGVPLEINFSRMQAPDGEFFLVSMLDITKRKKAEAALHEANAELLQQANDRALRMQAEAAQAEAEAANRAKDHFLAMLSHELRTPLSPVLNAVNLLCEEECTDSMRELLAIIRRNVRLEARLIDDLLDLAKVRNGKLQLHIEQADGHELLNRALDIWKPEIAANDLRVKMDLRAGDTRLNADPARIQQIFWNLIANAIKYTPRSGEIVLASSNSDGMVQVEITDSGIGIEPGKIDGIFNAFTQAHENRSHGLGLGLAICRALTELHGGAIEARSAGMGRGATFSVKLPVARDAVAASSAPAAAQSTEAQFPLRLLLVEDHADTIQSLARLLTRSGYKLRMATNTAEAMQIAREYEFDVLVSDIGLPDGNGLDLMRRIAADAGARTVHGIALSGFGMQEDLDRSRDAGFAFHFTKPVDIVHLRAALNRIGRERANPGSEGILEPGVALPNQ